MHVIIHSEENERRRVPFILQDIVAQKSGYKKMAIEALEKDFIGMSAEQ